METGTNVITLGSWGRCPGGLAPPGLEAGPVRRGMRPHGARHREPPGCSAYVATATGEPPLPPGDLLPLRARRHPAHRRTDARAAAGRRRWRSRAARPPDHDEPRPRHRRRGPGSPCGIHFRPRRIGVADRCARTRIHISSAITFGFVAGRAAATGDRSARCALPALAEAPAPPGTVRMAIVDAAGRRLRVRRPTSGGRR